MIVSLRQINNIPADRSRVFLFFPMQLSRPELIERAQSRSLKLAFIGMSNVGKTHWSRRLVTDFGWHHYEVDEAIQKSLGIQTSNLTEVAQWMGAPHEPQYPEKSRLYLEAEEAATAQIPTLPEGNLVVDTTGSFAHLSPKTREFIQQNYLVVNFDVSEKDIAIMIDDYFKEPKPVVWGDLFTPNEGESNRETLCRCYPKLINFRQNIFRQTADVNFPREFTNNPQVQSQRWWEMLQLSVPKEPLT